MKVREKKRACRLPDDIKQVCCASREKRQRHRVTKKPNQVKGSKKEMKGQKHEKCQKAWIDCGICYIGNSVRFTDTFLCPLALYISQELGVAVCRRIDV